MFAATQLAAPAALPQILRPDFKTAPALQVKAYD
jgi:hypothetical protein